MFQFTLIFRLPRAISPFVGIEAETMAAQVAASSWVCDPALDYQVMAWVFE
jgi:hypothetical protein